MVVNFRARGISRGARKLARTSTLNLKKKKNYSHDDTLPRANCTGEITIDAYLWELFTRIVK